MKRARLAGIGLLLSSGYWPACRHVSVCDGDVDCARLGATAGEGGALVAEDGEPGGVGEAGGSGASFDTNAGAAPSAASGAAGEPTGGQPPVGPACAAGRADCDESTLTVCETPTNFSFRHCGACNARCDGACSVGKCKPAERLFDKGVESFAANASAAFALIAAPGDTENLHRFDLETGADTVLIEGLEEDAELLLAADRLYAYYPYQDRVVSLGLDGSGATTEAFSPESFGATSAGVYYTSYVTDAETGDDTWTLWFKGPTASAFTAISQGRECDILASSSQALLVWRETTSGAEILLAQGAELTLLGDSPGEPLAAAAAADGAVFLLPNDTAPAGYELVWLQPDEAPRHIELEAEPAGLELVPAPEGVALQLDDHNNTVVRLFSPDGAEIVPLGIPNYSTLAFVDERYVWYSWYGAPDFTQQFRRARQFEPNDILP